jgi:CBS domain-containing protein
METEVSAMRVKDLMSSPVVCVSPETPLKQVASILVERRISGVPVVDSIEHLVGIVSEGDLVPLQSTPDPLAHAGPTRPLPVTVPTRADEVMTRTVICLPPDADAAEAARAMIDRRVKSVPIVDRDRVVGIVSRRDLLRTMVRDDSEIKADVEALLLDEAFVVGGFAVSVTGGAVTLSPADSRSERRLAELLVRSVPGVLGVRFESVAPVGAKG